MKRIILIATIILTGWISFGQQDAQFTQYMDNHLYVNPAYAGSGGMMNVTSIHREQWVGMDGAPRSTSLSLHSPLTYESLGMGLTVVNDKVGPINQTMIYVDFSYTLKFKKGKGKLSFGLKTGVNMINSRTNELTTTQVNDPSFLGASQMIVNPNFGSGIYYHTPKWFLGASAPKILEGNYPGSDRKLEKRHYFIIAGGVFDIHKNWKLRPTSQVKLTEGATVSVDLSLAGLTHRFGDSFGGFVQFQISPQFKAGLAYDYTTTELSSYNIGTFEVLLSYDFIFKKEGIRSPRYF
jgi:type IX secretion system PorP/SprF family membrane protein